MKPFANELFLHLYWFTANGLEFWNGLFAQWRHFTTKTESLRVLLSSTNYTTFVIETSLGLPDLDTKEQTKWILILVVKRTHRASGLLTSELLNPYLFSQILCGPDCMTDCLFIFSFSLTKTILNHVLRHVSTENTC